MEEQKAMLLPKFREDLEGQVDLADRVEMGDLVAGQDNQEDLEDNASVHQDQEVLTQNSNINPNILFQPN